MDDQKIRESILRTVNEEIDSWLANKDAIKDPLEYEKRLFEHSMRFGKSLLVNSDGKLSKDRNKKKGLLHFLERLI